MKTIDRVRLIEDMAVMIARHRMSDTFCLLDPQKIVTQGDRALALHLVRVGAPLYPLPKELISDEVRQRAEGNTSIEDRPDGSKRATIPCPFCGAGGFIAFNVTEGFQTFSVTAMCGECGKSRDCTVSCDPKTFQIKVQMQHERSGNA